MTLHNAIIEVLRDAGEAMTAPAITAEINRRGSYSRKDRKPLPANQIWARVCMKRYAHIFAHSDGLIGLK